VEDEQIKKIIRSIIKKAGPEKNLEVSVTTSESHSFEYEKTRLKNVEYFLGTSLALRLTLKDGRFGVATTNNLKKWGETLKECESIAKANKPDPNFTGLPSIKPVKKNVYGQELERYTEEEIIKNVEESIKNLDVTVQTAGATKTMTKSWFANPQAFQDQEISNHLNFSISVKKGGATAFESHEQTKWFNFKDWALKAQDLCLKSLKPKKTVTQITNLLLDYYALQSIIARTLIPSVIGENVQKGRSPYTGKIGKKVCGEELTVIDDGSMKKSLFQSQTDGEGVKTGLTTIIDKGLLKNFLYDHYSARKEGKVSTGNCAGITARPIVGATNFMIKPGNWSREELLNCLKKRGACWSQKF